MIELNLELGGEGTIVEVDEFEVATKRKSK